MVQIAQGVDDRNGGPVGQLLDGGLRKGARDDGLYPAIQIAGYILDWLTGADRAFAEDRVAAELFDGQFEGEAGAQGSLLEEQPDILAGEGPGILARRLFHIERDIEQTGELVVGEVEIASQVGGRDSGDLLVGEGKSGHGGTS